jgi:hypothetical protein
VLAAKQQVLPYGPLLIEQSVALRAKSPHLIKSGVTKLDMPISAVVRDVCHPRGGNYVKVDLEGMPLIELRKKAPLCEAAEKRW